MSSTSPGHAPPSQPRLRLSRLEIENFKGIDHLVLDLPLPEVAGRPDVFVLGSENGVGKTSVLEAIALVRMAFLNRQYLQHALAPGEPNAWGDYFVRSGKEKSSIRVCFQSELIDDTSAMNSLRSGSSWTTLETELWTHRLDSRLEFNDSPANQSFTQLLGLLHFPTPKSRISLNSLLGNDTNPLLAPRLAFFHSYRKVSETQPPFGGLGEPQDIGGLPSLLEEFANSTFLWFRPIPNNRAEFLLQPKGGGPSISFDGLSSGQKEMISTLYLIQSRTRDYPGIVLIDEPELHLNAQWHGLFVRKLFELAPWNQYILATHSEHVFAAVDEDRRILLARGGA